MLLTLHSLKSPSPSSVKLNICHQIEPEFSSNRARPYIALYRENMTKVLARTHVLDTCFLVWDFATSRGPDCECYKFTKPIFFFLTSLMVAVTAVATPYTLII